MIGEVKLAEPRKAKSDGSDYTPFLIEIRRKPNKKGNYERGRKELKKWKDIKAGTSKCKNRRLGIMLVRAHHYSCTLEQPLLRRIFTEGVQRNERSLMLGRTLNSIN